MALLEVDKLNLSFAGLQVIKDLSFTVEQGSIASLIGPNGAGKTSVFNWLTGVDKPGGGRIVFNGKALTRKRPFKITQSGMARTFQNLRLLQMVCQRTQKLTGGRLLPLIIWKLL